MKIDEENANSICQIEELSRKIEALEIEKSVCLSEFESLKDRLIKEEERCKDYDGIVKKVCDLEDKLARKTLDSCKEVEALENELKEYIHSLQLLIL